MGYNYRQNCETAMMLPTPFAASDHQQRMSLRMATSDFTPKKRCTQCGNEFPRTAKFFCRKKENRDGLASKCKGCANQYFSQWRQKNLERDRQRKQAYVGRNPEKVKESKLEWFEKHPDYKQEYALRHREQYREGHHRRYLEQRDQRLKKGKENYRRNRQRKLIYARNYRQNNPSDPRKQAVITHRRLARKKGLPDNFRYKDWVRALNYFDNCCAICGRSRGLWHTLAMDHWVPLSDPNCPGTVPENIVPLCHGLDGCNNSKGKQSPEIWLKERFGETKARKVLAKIQAYFSWVKDESNG